MLKLDESVASWVAWIETIPVSPVLLVAFLSALGLAWNRRKERLNALEQNFDVLQRLNETALSSENNLRAAVESVDEHDTISMLEARKIFFHYLRINRLYRAYEMHRIGALRRRDRNLIFDNYVGTLISAVPIIHGLADRGYSKKFVSFLLKRIKDADPPQRFDELLDSKEADTSHS